MTLSLLQRKKIQQLLILVLGIVILVTVTVLWIGYFKKEPAPVVELQGIVNPISKSVDINFGVLSLPLLQELDAPADPVLEPELKGRSNPFLRF